MARATFDAVLSAEAEGYLARLNLAQREAFYEALTALMSDPLPDGDTKGALPFPRERRTFAFAFGAFTMTYTFDDRNPLVILNTHVTLDGEQDFFDHPLDGWVVEVPAGLWHKPLCPVHDELSLRRDRRGGPLRYNHRLCSKPRR